MMMTLMEKKRQRGRVASTRRPEARVTEQDEVDDDNSDYDQHAGDDDDDDLNGEEKAEGEGRKY